MKFPNDEDMIESVLFCEAATVVQFRPNTKEPASRKSASTRDCCMPPRIWELLAAARGILGALSCSRPSGSSRPGPTNILRDEHLDVELNRVCWSTPQHTGKVGAKKTLD